MKDLLESIKEKSEIDNETGCWNWKGKLNINGYASQKEKGIGKKYVIVSRFICKFIKKSDPEGLDACHTCDNPKCVNPDHLFLGTRQDNMNDMKNKGRGKCYIGEKNNRAKLTENDVRLIRKLKGTLKIKELAEIYGVSPTAIGNILKRISWSHIS